MSSKDLINSAGILLKAFNEYIIWYLKKLKGFNHYQKNISYLRRVNN